MATFSDIIGQEQMKEYLQNALATGKISHAYIMNGEKFAGKEFIAKVFAMALQCESGEDKPCIGMIDTHFLSPSHFLSHTHFFYGIFHNVIGSTLFIKRNHQGNRPHSSQIHGTNDNQFTPYIQTGCQISGKPNGCGRADCLIENIDGVQLGKEISVHDKHKFELEE